MKEILFVAHKKSSKGQLNLKTLKNVLNVFKTFETLKTIKL